MAAELIKSTQVSNADATPRVPNNDFVAAADPFETVAVCPIASGVTTGSIYRFGRVSSSARVSDVQVMNDAITGGTAYKCGFLETTANGGGVASGVSGADALLFTGVTMAAARNVWTPLAFHGAAVANVTKRVWELLGLSADPFKTYDVAVTGTTTTSAAGNLALRYQQAI